MSSEVLAKLEKPKTQYCTSCKKRLQIYRKVWYVRDDRSIIAVKVPNDFYVCENNECSFRIYLKTGIKIRAYTEVFEWVKYNLF